MTHKKKRDYHGEGSEGAENLERGRWNHVGWKTGEEGEEKGRKGRKGWVAKRLRTRQRERPTDDRS